MPATYAYIKTWRQKNAERDPLFMRNESLKARYGITVDDYAEMLEKQGGTCSLCPKTEAENTHGVLCVDHCHDTGRVRGLLCTACNVTLGRFDDDPARFRRAAEYLEAAR